VSFEEIILKTGMAETDITMIVVTQCKCSRDSHDARSKQ